MWRGQPTPALLAGNDMAALRRAIVRFLFQSSHQSGVAFGGFRLQTLDGTEIADDASLNVALTEGGATFEVVVESDADTGTDTEDGSCAERCISRCHSAPLPESTAAAAAQQ